MALSPGYNDESVLVIETFIRDKVRDARAKGAVLGLSGGLDSAVVATMCARALGSERVLCIMMPDATTPPQEMEDARELALQLEVEHMTVDIDPVLDIFRQKLGGDVEDHAFGNVKARARMTVLYYHGQIRDYLVMGTGNKSELLMGYFTKYGDGGVDYQPLGDLYKTQVRSLAADIGLPAKFIEKPPSANLLPGQTDEDDMGIAYEDLDRILLGIEIGMGDGDIEERTGLPGAEVARVRGIVTATKHKRRIPLAPKLGIRTIGWDWRE
ncbi:MAG: NAD+ synthase [Thermoplasmata archaeon]|nr:NAD+ synthase [Thermoplasmata archaeon]NIS12840.1 NAD+ synthase [Thermoplasmata archaeon]NIS20745.1 NAD+ synthase [Thermoplasmata archaeon]NIT78149.1 NAD+ synthase [Thermoplasmata archaeon]NIU49816.1 NAD+ synthase [Thermoplasmata archaeon]